MDQGKIFVHVEPIAYIIRIFINGKMFGDRYNILMVAKHIDDELIEICGLDNPMSLSEMRAVRDKLASMGYKRAFWYRIKDGKTHKMEYHLKQNKKALDK